MENQLGIAERGLLLDVARKFYTLEELRSVIDLMSKNELTHLQLHFSDNEGFRIESDWVKPSDQHYTKAEIRDFLVYAKTRQITIVPELDSPGHWGHILAQYPELKLTDTAMNLTDEAITLSKNLLAEMLALFSENPIFHIGGDEFVDFAALPDTLVQQSKLRFGEKAQGLETYVTYLNQIAEFISQQGKEPRVWNDGLFRKSQILPSSKLTVTYWTRWHEDMAKVSAFGGYKLINFCDNYLYYVIGEAAGYTYPTPEKLEAWSPTLFADGQVAESSGAYFSVWGDRPTAQTFDEIYASLSELLPVFMKKIKEATK
ncbi:lacto-N-biosidase [Bacilli bacterium]|nr:lacto-N-biosidase [Bacilli bacterium]GHU39873.1 lacto-N-biosidase [Bacilli bacterium]